MALSLNWSKLVVMQLADRVFIVHSCALCFCMSMQTNGRKRKHYLETKTKFWIYIYLITNSVHLCN